MLRRPQAFARVGRGKWALTRQTGAATETDFGTMTQVDAAVVTITSIGRPATIAEILDRLEEKGFKHKTDRDHTYNSFYSAFTRSQKIQRSGNIGEGRWQLAPARSKRSEPEHPFSLSG